MKNIPRLFVLLIAVIAITIFGIIFPDQNDNNQQLVYGTIGGETDSLEVNALVTDIVDGDTIKVQTKNGDTQTVRLIGIDTPESVHPQKPVECFAIEASKYLEELILDEQVKLEFDPTQGEADRYGRLLAYVWLGEDNINEKMIKNGFAYEYTYNFPYKYQDKFMIAEENAISNQKGLWGKSCNL